MLYSSLTTAELERWVYASPNDGMALVEMMKRGPKLLRQECEAVDHLQAEIAMLEDQHKAEMNVTLSDLNAAESRIRLSEEKTGRFKSILAQIADLVTN